jgi:hypothetical protein
MNVLQTTVMTMAADIGGGSSIAMGGLKAVIYTMQQGEGETGNRSRSWNGL